MTPVLRRWLVALAVASAITTACRAAGPDRASEAAPEAPALETLPLPLTCPEPWPAYVLPPPGWREPVDPVGGDPLLDRPYSAQPGFFADVGVNVLWLHLRNQLRGPVFNEITGNTDTVAFSGNKLDPAVSPRFEVGYRLPDNWGSLSFGYRFLASQGHDQLTTGPEDVVQAPANQFGRIDYNMVDFFYGSREYSLDPNWNMRWGIGARMVFLYFDSRVDFINPASDAGTILAQSKSNHMRSYGPWGYLDIERRTGIPGLTLVGRTEAADSYARVDQIYRETVAGGPGAAAQTFSGRFTGASGPVMLRGVVGLSYTVPGWNYSRFLIGYQYEAYFEIGRLSPFSGIVDTRAQLDAQGLFLRGEFNF
jgi:hypothetical protein